MGMHPVIVRKMKKIINMFIYLLYYNRTSHPMEKANPCFKNYEFKFSKVYIATVGEFLHVHLNSAKRRTFCQLF